MLSIFRQIFKTPEKIFHTERFQPERFSKKPTNVAQLVPFLLLLKMRTMKHES